MSVKTSELPELNINNTASNDYIPIVDTSEEILKKIKYSNFSGRLITGVCNSNAGDQYKKATLSDIEYVPKIGDYFEIQFTNRNTYISNPELNINNTGSHKIKLKGSANTGLAHASNVIVYWNGDYYEIVAADCPYEAYTTERASKTASTLRIQAGTGSTYEFNGSRDIGILEQCSRVAIPASGWTSSLDSSGYYNNTVTLPVSYSTFKIPFISLTGQNDSTEPTYNQKLFYEQIDRFDFEQGNSVNQMIARCKLRPSETVYVLVSGILLS